MNERQSVASGSQRELMQLALQQTYEFGLQLSQISSAIIHHFQQGKNAEAVNLLAQFLEGIQWVSQALHVTHPLQVEKRQPIELNALSEGLTSLVGALESKDYGLVQDILNYEIQPILSVWCDQIQALNQGVVNAGN